MTAEQIKTNIKETLQSFAKGNLTENSIELFKKLGYVTERCAPLYKPTYEEFKDTYITDKNLSAGKAGFDEAKAKTIEWKFVDLLFQLSKEEVLKETSLFDTKQVDRTAIETYLFFAIELSGEQYSRTELSVITREVNRLFPMPAMILFKHGKTITLSAINRRLHKRDESKDVLEKVTLIKDIVIENPHRGHLEILFDLSFDELKSKYQFTNFVELHNAWQKTLDTKELNKRFYSELFNWYLWAVRSVNFPNDIDDDKDDMVNNSENVIRLLTRLIFVWFIKEKNLVPDSLFELKKLKNILKDFKPQSEETSVYYRAVLQNLFFATLNTPMDKDITAKNKDEQRRFINTLPKTDNDQYLDQTKYRYQNYFTTPDKALELFSSIPFLNGGLFECLDFKEGNKEIRLDGFSSTGKRQAFIPDKLFFAEKHPLDLNIEYGTKNKKYEVEGLINILDSYKFTITENTPLEEEIALDPELLGKVFENLLASYNPETQTTARKQTGSFYTPREIVNYMVDESLIAYFKSIVSIPARVSKGDSSIPAHVDNDNNLENEFFNPDNEIDIHQGNLPHWQQENVWYFITFRLADSIPAKVVEQIKQERELWLKKYDKNNLTTEQKKEYYKLFSERTENLLNAGKGCGVFKNEKIAKIVSEALLHFNNQRYILDEWVIMPNHVHIVFKPFEGYSLPDILHSWKSFTANEINKVTGNKGQLWMHESYDHIVRNEKALQAIRRYIWDNPVKAGINLPSVCLSSNRSKDASDTFETKLRDLFTHVIDLPEFTKSETDVFINAISEVKILDPACGSGAFPMGVLHRMVDLLNKLDPDNKKWNELQKQRAIAETAEVFDSGDVSEREIRLNEINKAFDLSMNYPDYARKLFLIENCIYGVDIQQIAIQISKLRFFISLIVDQKVDDSKPNRNILSMPNLETRFVAANTLIGLDKPQQMTLMAGDVERLEKELGGIRRKIFFTRKYSEKKILKKKEKAKREELQIALTQSGFSKNVAGQMAGWNPFDPMQSAKFFDPETMFGFKDGFDVVIGNPPYINISNLKPDEYRLALRNKFRSAKNKSDTYAFFLEQGFTLLQSQGILTYIIPQTWKATDSFSKLREILFKEKTISKIVDLEFGTFDAIVKPMVVVILNAFGKDNSIEVYNEAFEKISEIKISEILKDSTLSINTTLNKEQKRVFQIIEKNSIPLESIIQFSRGIKTSDDTRFIHTSANNRDYKKVFRGKNIKAFVQCSCFVHMITIKIIILIPLMFLVMELGIKPFR
jgi:REP element-mobilizing transposase RayT